MLRNEFYDLRCRENERKEQQKWFLNFLIFILKVLNFNCSFPLWWSVWWRRKTEGTKGKRKWNESYDFRSVTSVFIRYYCMRVCLVSENRTERTRNFIKLWLSMIILHESVWLQRKQKKEMEMEFTKFSFLNLWFSLTYGLFGCGENWIKREGKGINKLFFFFSCFLFWLLLLLFMFLEINTM